MGEEGWRKQSMLRGMHAPRCPGETGPSGFKKLVPLQKLAVLSQPGSNGKDIPIIHQQEKIIHK